MNDEKPFDAAESYLCEADRQPSAKWRTVSLVTAILRLIDRSQEAQSTAAERRRTTIKAAATELTARGLDATALIRYGMTQEVVAPIVSALTVKLIFGADPAANEVDATGWCSALLVDPPLPSVRDISTNEISDRFNDLVLPVIPLIRQWVRNASLDDVITLAAPQRGQLAADSVTLDDEPELHKQYRWMVDHFAKTFYRDWGTTSLHNELKWLDGDISSPCPDELMHDRAVTRRDLVEEIARRAVYQTKPPGVGDSISAEMTRHAINLLHQGRLREAVAVFEFGITQRPYDPGIRNNLGFCLIPLDPNQALDHLEAAANMGYPSSATNTYNQMCCYLALGRSRAALNAASAEWAKIGPLPQEALLWKPTRNGEWKLYVGDAAWSIASLGVEIAHQEGWEDQEELWRLSRDARGIPPEPAA